MQRSFDPKVMEEAMGRYPELDHPGFDYEAWVGNKKHIMLREGDSVALGTCDYDGAYTAHFFYTVRGKEALDLAKRMLAEMFDTYGAKVMRGLTPVEYKAARWVNRKMGFKSLGIIDTDTGPHEIFCLTRAEYYNKEQQDGQ